MPLYVFLVANSHNQNAPEHTRLLRTFSALCADVCVPSLKLWFGFTTLGSSYVTCKFAVSIHNKIANQENRPQSNLLHSAKKPNKKKLNLYVKNIIEGKRKRLEHS